MLIQLLYNFFIKIYVFNIYLASFFNKKALCWVSGRKGIFARMRSELKQEQSPIIWFHAASLGEFEQGRPVIEAIKDKVPHYRILLTFFSPSGYEVRKDYQNADYIFYLPSDTTENARKFLDIVQPELTVFIKYEYWFNYLKELHKRALPHCFISSVFSPTHYFFKFYGQWGLNKLKNVSHFFVQDETSMALLKKHGISQVSVSGDTRFDRVSKITHQPKDFNQVAAFAKNHKVIIAGSTWPADDKLIFEFLRKSTYPLKYIIAPHDINAAYIERLKNKTTPKGCLFTELTTENAPNHNILIINGMGYLSHIYRYADIAYIGGGFGKGIHNILEAACWGLPVFFGPNHKKFSEAVKLIEINGAFSINSSEEMLMQVNKLLKEPKYYSKVSENNKTYVNNNSGATQKIVNTLFDKYLKN